MKFDRSVLRSYLPAVPHIRLDFPDPDRTGPAVFTDPVRVVRADTLDQVVPALEAVHDAAATGLHAAGFVAYEAAPALDPAMATRQPGRLPLAWFGLFEAPVGVAGLEEEYGEGQQTEGEQPPEARADEVCPDRGREVESDGPPSRPIPWRLELTRAEHAEAVRRIREAIAEGRTYQVNLTARLRAPFEGDPDALYHRLRRTQGGGWHALLDTGRHVVVSASPELFFETRGRSITTRPMKGTRPRGRWPDEDRALADALRTSAKDGAENLMIVDLIRNDLGRVCLPGSIRVPALRKVERYRTVWQLTSTVTGTLRDDVGLPDLFRALFPCGSVTGAPKISTMDLITTLEPSPREVYCGAIGWVRPGGDATFSVPIRTAWIDRAEGRIAYGAGGGVVWDSTAEAEWDELVAKTTVAGAPWPPFRLLETLAAEAGRPLRLERHLARMADAADRFSFPFPEEDVRAAVLRAAAGPDRRRLRVTLGSDGGVHVDSTPLDRVGTHEPDDGSVPLPVSLARSPVDPSDPFLYHKTTHRDVYRRHLEEAPDHVFDVLLWNEDGEVTEFCRGNLVAETDGRLVTPPRTAGLLPGCYRAELLDRGRIQERPLAIGDVTSASRLWFINSARRWIPVRLEP